MLVNMHEAKTQLSQLVKRAVAGEDVIIARNGTPAVRLVPVGGRVEPRRPGALRGRIAMADDFDDLPPEVADAFAGHRP